jgi:hypothetical protein
MRSLRERTCSLAVLAVVDGVEGLTRLEGSSEESLEGRFKETLSVTMTVELNELETSMEVG